MATYLVLKRLLRKRLLIEPGSRSRLEWLTEEGRAVLVERRAVRELASPPLGELAGWQSRAKKLAGIKIETADDFLEADPVEIRRCLRVKAETVEKYQVQLRAWVTSDEKTGRGR